MFDWIDNLACGFGLAFGAAVGILFSYTWLMICGSSYQLLYKVFVVNGCSFKHPVLASNRMPCRSTLIGEIL